ncbi:MAG: cyanophycinase [Armatimonadota bacterium]
MALLFVCAADAADPTTGPPKGTLVVYGGGRGMEAIFRRFVELAGGQDAKIVIVPTAASSRPDFDYENRGGVRLARETLGLPNVVVLHTQDRKEADTDEFVRPIREADGIWFGGGRQWRFADAYLGTLAEREFHKVLERGGAIGGTSAGATIQGSFLARGDTAGNRKMIGDHTVGFGFIRNCAIDQHVLARNRQLDLIEIITAYPHLLGIGLDEGTAIIVRGNELEVVGASAVLIYDHSSWEPDTPDDEKYVTLSKGDRYDMKARQRLPSAASDHP